MNTDCLPVGSQRAGVFLEDGDVHVAVFEDRVLAAGADVPDFWVPVGVERGGAFPPLLGSRRVFTTSCASARRSIDLAVCR